MKRILFTAVFVCFAANWSFAQTILPDVTLDHSFSVYVKSVNEFMQRFNGEELHPNVKKTDADSRSKNLMWLFNFDVKDKTKMLPKMQRFIKRVVDSGTQLNFNDSTWFAEVGIVAKYKGQNVSLMLYLRTDPTPKPNYCWKLCGLKGLDKTGLFTPGKQSGISNIEHELNFAELQSIFKNDKANLFNYISTHNHIDQLSAFLALCKTGQMSFVQVEKVGFVFTSVPDYIFRIKEYGRRSDNAGWLISSFEECNDKQTFINKLIQ